MPALRNKSYPPFTAKDLRSLKLLARFREVLDDVLVQQQAPLHRSFADPKRHLHLGDYLSLFLLGLFNPIARTVRGLALASSLPKVCAQLGVTKVSLGSFSETQQLVEPALLEHLFTSLAGELPDLKKLPPSLESSPALQRAQPSIPRPMPASRASTLLRATARNYFAPPRTRSLKPGGRADERPRAQAEAWARGGTRGNAIAHRTRLSRLHFSWNFGPWCFLP